MPNEWFGARRAIGARALASKLADALRLIISRKFLLQIRSPHGAVLIKNSLHILFLLYLFTFRLDFVEFLMRQPPKFLYFAL